MADLIVNLYDLQCKYNPEKLERNGITIKRVLSPDKKKVLDFVEEYYEGGWVYETEHGLMNTPISCYVAVKDQEIVGFACYDATAKGYFGPIGIKPGEKGSGIGQGLMYHTLMGMKEAGYGYAIIGWVDEAKGFYEKTINAVEIPNSQPENTIYKTLTHMS